MDYSNQVIDLAKATKLEVCGGKATSLARLITSGFNVPDGFVVTTETKNILTDDLAPLILLAFRKLEAQYVAVRSSAVAEDGTKASWAGQLETFLNVSEPKLLDSIQKCWQSTQSAHAVAYAAKNNISAGYTAVLIQKMIQPDVSGVAFSVHPVTQDSNTVVIEAVFGLGEALVSGTVTPDTYVVEKNLRSRPEVHLGNQLKQLILGSGKNQWQPTKSGSSQKLTIGQITDLTRLIIRLERFYGLGVDVEWALQNNTLYILQCRPITTLG